MPGRQYSYQYGTSPRKIKPDYNRTRRNELPYNKTKQKTKTKNKVKQPEKKIVRNTNRKKEDLKSKNILIAKTRMSVFFKCALLFLLLFFMIFMNTRLSESISQIQKLKAQITELQKENDQLSINIQNNINLNNIEQAAKELLGMQKLSNRQTLYINLPKTDYIEPRTEMVIIEENKTSAIENLIQKVKDIF